MLKLDVSSPREIAKDLMHVTLEAAAHPPENASTLKSTVMITTNVLLILVIRIPENALTPPSAVTTTTHVPLTAVTEILDCASTSQRSVTTTTHVPEILATPRLENVSLRISHLKSSPLAPTSVLSQNAILSKDLFKLLLNAHLTINVQRPTATHLRDVSLLLLFVINLIAEQPSNVTQLLEFVKQSFLTVMITTHVL
jgi:hypothetical protein